MKQLHSWKKRAAQALSWVRDVSISVVIAVIVIPIFYRPVKVEGTSMMPLLQDQDGIFINQFVYNFSDVSRQDLIVFRFPGDPSKSYIKRVVAIPGDTVEIVAGQLFVNGNAVDEPYVPTAYRDSLSMPRMRVPLDEYFVLGDHRSSSNDSRNWGTVPRRYVFGKAVFAYWPITKIGSLQ
jgi:signal peptidase I